MPRYILIIYPFAYPVSKSMALFFSVSCKSTNLASYMAPVSWACACASCPHPGSVRFFENASIGRILSIIICGYYKLQPYIYTHISTHMFCYYILLVLLMMRSHIQKKHDYVTQLQGSVIHDISMGETFFTDSYGSSSAILRFEALFSQHLQVLRYFRVRIYAYTLYIYISLSLSVSLFLSLCRPSISAHMQIYFHVSSEHGHPKKISLQESNHTWRQAQPNMYLFSSVLSYTEKNMKKQQRGHGQNQNPGHTPRFTPSMGVEVTNIRIHMYTYIYIYMYMISDAYI